MARLVVDGTDLVVRLTPAEMLVARRREVRVPRTDVRHVVVEPDRWRGLRGVRRSGRWLPDRFCVGEWRHPDGRDFGAVRGRGPVVVAGLAPSAPFERLTVSVPDAESVVRAIRQER
ncbi:hypothetical protein [Streptomyces brasiliensis]|uniref:Uncharacterized protein n=1 Tax=Streptomyces brasiliensis TaxID=1954 RepID=A0A917NUS2_9ACTN|nr:hypothetical protein [Streptomyces brasiliensis]GGJ30287.1 hypothetical protein GCM10010121_047040 [Streptomyces brasiliensis]